MRLTLALPLLLVGCAFTNTARKMNALSLGMTKADVIDSLGSPASTSATEGVEFLNYSFPENDSDAMYGIARPYFVKLKDGKVVAYGKRGDFGSTETPRQTIRVEMDGQKP